MHSDLLKRLIFARRCRQYQSHIRGLNAYDRHKKFINDYGIGVIFLFDFLPVIQSTVPSKSFFLKIKLVVFVISKVILQVVQIIGVDDLQICLMWVF